MNPQQFFESPHHLPPHVPGSQAADIYEDGIAGDPSFLSCNVTISTVPEALDFHTTRNRVHRGSGPRFQCFPDAVGKNNDRVRGTKSPPFEPFGDPKRQRVLLPMSGIYVLLCHQATHIEDKLCPTQP